MTPPFKLPESEYCAWLKNGEKVNAFPHGCDNWQDDRDGYWTRKGYSKAPLFTADQMQAAIEEAAPKWRPIKTAPRDGTAFLACLEASEIPHAMRFDKDGQLSLTWDGYAVADHDWPTHWMPLPPPVSDGGKM